MDQTVKVFYAQICGATWIDADADGVWDDGERGVADRKIYLDQNQNGQFDDGETSAITDSNGEYAFTNVLPGTHTVAQVIESAGAGAQTYPADAGTHVVVLQAADSVEQINFGNQPQIRGTKWHDTDGDGVRDADEPGIAGWTIFLDENDNGRLDYNGLSSECVGNPVADGWTGHVLNGTNVKLDTPEVGSLRWHGNAGGGLSTGTAGTYKKNTKAGGWVIEWATNRVATGGDATRETVVIIDDDTNMIRVQFDADPADGGGVTLLDGMPVAGGGGSSVRFAYDVKSGYHVFRLQRKKGSATVELYVGRGVGRLHYPRCRQVALGRCEQPEQCVLGKFPLGAGLRLLPHGVRGRSIHRAHRHDWCRRSLRFRRSRTRNLQGCASDAKKGGHRRIRPPRGRTRST